MGGLTSEDLRKLADELDAREQAEVTKAEKDRLDALEAKLAEKTEAESALSADDLAFIREMREERDRARREDRREQDDDDDEGDDDGKPAAKERKPKVKTRPGRKNSQAYDFTVDEQGNVIRDGMAHIYSGEDEPDEVELPAEAA